ncbi:MAG: hypothetical protein J2P16_07185 [Mycobacterium sp.]|nr:hypothetical protein [Mycobacterium sp.]
MSSDYVDTLVRIRDIAANLYCDCYQPELMEYDPAGPCPRCQLIAAVDQLLDRVDTT